MVPKKRPRPERLLHFYEPYVTTNTKIFLKKREAFPFSVSNLVLNHESTSSKFGFHVYGWERDEVNKILRPIGIQMELPLQQLKFLILSNAPARQASLAHQKDALVFQLKWLVV